MICSAGGFFSVLQQNWSETGPAHPAGHSAPRAEATAHGAQPKANVGSPGKTKSPSLALLSCDLLCSARLFWAKIKLKPQSLLQQHQSFSGYLSETLGAGFAALAGQRLWLGVVALLRTAWPLPGSCLPLVGLEQQPSHHLLLMFQAALSHPCPVSL